MPPLLSFLLLTTVVARNLWDFRRTDEEPFQVNGDLFNSALSLSPPDESNDIEELTVTTSRRYTGPSSSFDLVTALPPGYNPMPPGFRSIEERDLVSRETKGPAIFDFKEDRFRIAEMDSDKYDSHDKAEEELEDLRREERKFVEDIKAASAELDLLTTTNGYDSDETNLIVEGSGIFKEEQTKQNTSREEGSGRTLGSSSEEIAFLVNLPTVKISGEVGDENYEQNNKVKKNVVDVNTFLFPSVGIDDFHNRTEAVRGAVEGCPTPQLCAVNCFVSIDEDSCQICQCLWQAVTCEKDLDCPEISQKCDLGKCDCVEGFVQDMTRSGMCKQDENLSLESLGVKKEENIVEERRRKRRQAFGEKPRRAERLQWPGICDEQNHCPSPLFCIRGDCWQLPGDRPVPFSRQRDSVPDSFVIANDDNWEPEIKAKLPKRARAMMRFVGKPELNREQLERTTVASEEKEPNSLFEMKKTAVLAEEPQLAPSSITELFTSTHRRTVTEPSTEDFPPSPPPDNFEEDVSKLKWPQMPPDALANAFTKMIELPTEQVLKPKSRPDKKDRKMETIPISTTLDPIEFPISSQLDSLQRDGISVEPPLALSVVPTSEEVESHEQFMRALEEQRKRIQIQTSRRRSPMTSLFPTQNLEFMQTTTPFVLQSLRETEDEQKPGVWYEMRGMEEKKIVRKEKNIRRAPLTALAPPIKGRPVRINGIIGGRFEDECSADKQCGSRYLCCPKKWCDSSSTCSTARFCLPSCRHSKIINRSVGLVDLVDD